MSNNITIPKTQFRWEQSSFSGADMIASVTVPMITTDPANGINTISSKPITIGNLQTLSVSTQRQKAMVYTLGRIVPKGATRGVRVTAGTMVFALFDREALSEVQAEVRQFYQHASVVYNNYFNNISVPGLIPNFKPDELPPFDITVTMANEYGASAFCKITGVEIVTGGQVMGIDEFYLEEEMRYIAQDVSPLYPGFATASKS